MRDSYFLIILCTFLLGFNISFQATHQFWPTTEKYHNKCISSALRKFNVMEDKNTYMEFFRESIFVLYLGSQLYIWNSFKVLAVFECSLLCYWTLHCVFMLIVALLLRHWSWEWHYGSGISFNLILLYPSSTLALIFDGLVCFAIMYWLISVKTLVMTTHQCLLYLVL